MSETPIPAVQINQLEISGVDAGGSLQVYGDFQVRSFELVERLSEPYSLVLSLATRQRQLHVAGLVGGRSSLHIERGDFHRELHGVVFKAETIGVIQDKLCVRLFVAPALEVLSLSRSMRVFQGVTAIDIVKQVLEPVFARYQGKLDTTRIDHATFRTRDCCVQFHETDLELVQRLLAEEGIAFTFRHAGDVEEMVLLPMTAILHSVAGEDVPDPLTIPLCSREPELASSESIQNLQGSTRMRAGAAEAAMWDWKANPPARVAAREDPLDDDAALPNPNARFGEVYTFEHYRPVEEQEGGPLFELSAGEVKMLGHQQRLEDVRAAGIGNVVGFTDAATFEVNDHPTEDLDGLYVLLSVLHHAEFDIAADGMHVRSTSSYGNRFTCHRVRGRDETAYYTFAPPLRSKPTVHGPMTATVVGPAGEEIHTDEHGRIKVRMHWDRGEKDRDDHERSCWVPVGQTWAGPGFGAVFVPRVGMEVVIAFVGGDPDRPLCTGVIYNGQNRPPYPLPDNKTRSVLKTASSPGGGGFNELSFEDAAGAEEVFLHAQRNLREVVRRHHSTHVGGSQSCKVSGNQSNTVGGDRSHTVEKNETELIKGDVDVTVEGKRTRTITGEETTTCVAARKTYVGDTESHQVTGMLTESFDGGRTTSVAVGDGEVVTSGDKSVAVKAGGLSMSASSKVAVAQGGANALVLEGGAELTTVGDFTVTNKNVSVSSKGGALALNAADELTLECGSARIVMKKDGTITIEAPSTVDVRTLATSLVMKPNEAAITAPKISTQAVGVLEMIGALIRLNS